MYVEIEFIQGFIIHFLKAIKREPTRARPSDHTEGPLASTRTLAAASLSEVLV